MREGAAPATEPPRITWLETSAAACSGAILTSLFMTPLDVVRVRMQHPEAALIAASGSVPLTSASSVMLRVARHEGIASLWAGLQPALIMSVPGTVLYFSLYEASRDAIVASAPARPLRELAPLIAGGGARLLTATIVSPVELMRTRLQSSQALRSEGMIGGAMALVKREGWGALWKGLPPTLWRDVPFSMLYWTVYELLKARLLLRDVASGFVSRDVASGFVSRTAEGQPAQLEPVHSFACGAASGAFAAFLTTPFDVLKTRHQVTDQPGHQLSAQPAGVQGQRGTATKYPSTLALMAQIAQREGVGALFAGLGPRLAKVAPSCAIMIASYEMGKTFFRQRAVENGRT